jgi:hypothetical protein
VKECRHGATPAAVEARLATGDGTGRGGGRRICSVATMRRRRRCEDGEVEAEEAGAKVRRMVLQSDGARGYSVLHSASFSRG